MNYTSAAALGALLTGLVIYAVLRLARRTSDPGLPPMRPARRHAMWTALLALYVGNIFGPSSLSFLSGYWTTAESARMSDPTPVRDLVDAGGPLLAVVGVYLIAQFTGPRRGLNVRVVDLAVRRLQNYLPVRLTAFTAVLVFLGATAIALTTSVPGISPAGPVDDASAVPRAAARVAGTYFAFVAGSVYLVFALGVLTALAVIVRRRRVATLTHVEDSIMRRVFINRLLRTTAIVAVGILSSCLEFAAAGETDAIWRSLRLALAVLGFATVMVVIAARPRFEPADVDRQVDAPRFAPEGSIRRARIVVLSGRRIGYAAWCLGIVPLLLTIGAPLGGLVPLAVLSLAYLAFHAAQICAELFLAQNHGNIPRLDWHNARRLPVSLLVVAVPTLAAASGVGWLGGWISTVPGKSPELPFWGAAYCVVLGAAALLLVFTAARPAIRNASPAEDDHLRAASVRRALLMTHSSMLALAAFLLSDNRYALAPLDGDGAGMGPYSPGGGQLASLVIVVFLGAVVLAVLPGRRVHAPGAPAVPDATADAAR